MRNRTWNFYTRTHKHTQTLINRRSYFVNFLIILDLNFRKKTQKKDKKRRVKYKKTLKDAKRRINDNKTH
jgi:hypothetical protein